MDLKTKDLFKERVKAKEFVEQQSEKLRAKLMSAQPIHKRMNKGKQYAEFAKTHLDPDKEEGYCSIKLLNREAKLTESRAQTRGSMQGVTPLDNYRDMNSSS